MFFSHRRGACRERTGEGETGNGDGGQKCVFFNLFFFFLQGSAGVLVGEERWGGEGGGWVLLFLFYFSIHTRKGAAPSNRRPPHHGVALSHEIRLRHVACWHRLDHGLDVLGGGGELIISQVSAMGRECGPGGRPERARGDGARGAGDGGDGGTAPHCAPRRVTCDGRRSGESAYALGAERG